MSDYIEREALPQKRERGFFSDDDFNAGWNACLDKIFAIPAADVAPVRHGRWEEANVSVAGSIRFINYKCSACQKHEGWRTRFCPNCGADMRDSPKEETDGTVVVEAWNRRANGEDGKPGVKCIDCQRDCQMIGLDMPACTAYEPPKEE